MILLLPGRLQLSEKAHSRRRKAMDVNVVASLKDLINKDQGRSMRPLAGELSSSEATGRNEMAQYICCKSIF
jgi:hypothetical protein